MLSFSCRVALAVAALGASLSAQAGWAAPAAAPFLSLGERAEAPSGFLAMCRRDTQLCASGLPMKPDAMASAVNPAPMLAPGSVGFVEPSKSKSTAFIPAAFPAEPNRPLTIQDHVPTHAVLMRTSAPDESPVASPAVMPGGTELRSLVHQVNRAVNIRVMQLTDLATWGRDEYWSMPRKLKGAREAGDCEDIAIEKRVNLLAAGFPADRMSYAVVYKHNFGLHLVLIARLDDGDYVLDSATPRIDRWSDTNYVWLLMQSPGNPLAWYTPNTHPTRQGSPGTMAALGTAAQS